MVLRAGLPLQDMEFVQFHPTGIYGAGVLITEGARARAATSPIPRASASWSATPLRAKDLASRDVVSRSMAMEIREGAGWAQQGPHLPPPRPHRPEGAGRAAAGHHRKRQDLRRRRPDPPAAAGGADGALQHGRHPCNYHGEVVTIGPDGNPDTVVPGLFAVGEAACVSVHGANRLGFELADRPRGLRPRDRAPALKELITPGEAFEELPKDSADFALPARPLPPRQGRLAHRRDPRDMQRTMSGPLPPCSAPTR
jgi:succinate dehydrogenase / fumarate reductase, flavoprotein subunit